MTARDEALILLTQARSLPIHSQARTNLLNEATTLAVLAITEPRPQVVAEPEPTPKEQVQQAAVKRRASTKPKADAN